MPAINFPIDETTSANAQAAATARRPHTAGGSGRLGGGEPAPGGESLRHRPRGTVTKDATTGSITFTPDT